MSIDILIDTYSEYFRDDENKSDRFIDVYHENFRLVNICRYIYTNNNQCRHTII
jgi:hypothetical protein